jgi:uncharacterized protein with PIN domain
MDVRFEVDAMLVKLAHYLRVLGLDATYDLEASLATRIDRADAEGRVLLTRNHRIGHQEREPRKMIVVKSEDPVEQLREVVAACALVPEERLFSRCIRCNVDLDEVSKDPSIAACVPERVFAKYGRFWTCPKCGTVFWKGSHVRNTCRKLGLPDASETP